MTEAVFDLEVSARSATLVLSGRLGARAACALREVLRALEDHPAPVRVRCDGLVTASAEIGAALDEAGLRRRDQLLPPVLLVDPTPVLCQALHSWREGIETQACLVEVGVGESA